jgi:hypothetical protein
VTARRHRHYRRALDLLRGLEDGWLPPAGRKLLEELAEDMLLSRESDPHAVLRLRREAELAVGELSVVGVLPKTTAEELTQLLMGAGPPLLGDDGRLRPRQAA